jgi:hypothetical protein
VDPTTIALRVIASPTTVMRTSIQVSFADAEAREIRESFRSGTCTGNSGRAMITAAEATQLGKRLSEVLLPPVVFNLLAAGLAAALNRQRGGLRVRLVSGSLPHRLALGVSLPAGSSAGRRSFRLLALRSGDLAGTTRCRQGVEPGADYGRTAADLHRRILDDRRDGWNVWREFDQLRTALKPVLAIHHARLSPSRPISMCSTAASRRTPHYFTTQAHCDFDRNGRAFCVREMPESGALEQAAEDLDCRSLAKSLRRTDTRIAVLSACNSGFWSVVEPMIKAGVPGRGRDQWRGSL